MPILAEVVDAVVGVDTHRDTHEAELATTTGAVLARFQVANDTAGFTRLIEWIAQPAPGPMAPAAEVADKRAVQRVAGVAVVAHLIKLVSRLVARKAFAGVFDRRHR